MQPESIPIAPLRYLDVSMIQHEGEQCFLLSDPFGYMPDGALLPPGAFMLAAMFDGRRTAEEICRLFQKQSGMSVSRDLVLELARQLSEAGMLADEVFEQKRASVDESFLRSPVRQAWLAGRAYPEDPESLRSWLEERFRDGGPGMPTDVAPESGPPIRGLIAPHIDFARGGHIYAWAYRWLWAGGKPEFILLFGVAHTAGRTPFILCDKDFETPFGTVPVFRDALARLEQSCDWDPYEEQIIHRTEHSLELQAVMLALLYGDDAPPIIPVLCGMLTTPDMGEDAIPEDRPDVARFLDAARSLMADHPRAAAIAAADLSHVGERFGDDIEITPELVDTIISEDTRALEHVKKGDPAGFYRAIMRGGNPRHVCGMGCIYAAASAIGNQPFRPGSVSSHAFDPAGGVVTFVACASDRRI
ncbi:MAG TPA: AmmeMemoRadiSam system protein B [Candidatus Hydrogenedentes bacterium]|nr:AmmeMemoRadiSam system protein B [Candidatus Hydrogenedentota bacterium]HPU96474.1 AmmeMemoRadiSam system protein B [Candidatus Hydrogenedentota bacterium]